MNLFFVLDSDSSQALTQGDLGDGQDEVVRRRHGDKEVTFLYSF